MCRYQHWVLGMTLVWCVSCTQPQYTATVSSPVVTETRVLTTTATVPNTATRITETWTRVPVTATTTRVPETATPVPVTETTVVTNIPMRTQQKVQATIVARTTYTYVFPIANAPVSYGALHHDYMATDIFCDDGSQFVAVIDGIVDGIDAVDRWDPRTDDPALRSGLAVAIIGIDGNRYYGSHLSAIAPGLMVGMSVRAGQLLGYSGHSGNARVTPPHVHFGISRPSYAADWQVRRGEMNPYEFLRAWQKGESLQPVFLP